MTAADYRESLRAYEGTLADSGTTTSRTVRSCQIHPIDRGRGSIHLHDLGGHTAEDVTTSSEIAVSTAAGPDDCQIIRMLFREYMDSLGIDLSFQDADAELAGLPGKYALPGGALVIARNRTGEPLGCIALRPLAAPLECEIKRLYVRPQARGHSVGRLLVEAVLGQARRSGYARARLDTLPTMTAAQRLYAAFGFVDTEPYYENPIAGTRYLALDL